MDLAQNISANFNPCPIHIAKVVARVDKLYRNKAFSMDEFTKSEQSLINYITSKPIQYEPVHNLEYFLDIATNPHMRECMIGKEH